MAQIQAGLDGPSRTIIVEPIEQPTKTPAPPAPEPKRAPSTPVPEREREKTPA